FEPRLAKLVTPALLERAHANPSAWEAMLAAEPLPTRMLTAAEADEALRAVADFADLKSRHTAGNSNEIAGLCVRAATRAGLDAAATRDLRFAACVHDLGRAGVSVGVWDKSGALTDSEREQVRLHPYLTERCLARVPALARAAAIAGAHHERLDGTGYHRA